MDLHLLAYQYITKNTLQYITMDVLMLIQAEV